MENTEQSAEIWLRATFDSSIPKDNLPNNLWFKSRAKELAASVSPKLVMPERKEFNRFGDHLDDMHVQTWNMVLDELRRLNPSLFK